MITYLIVENTDFNKYIIKKYNRIILQSNVKHYYYKETAKPEFNNFHT
jgi:hypothetical protein